MNNAAPLHRRPLWLGALLAPLVAPFAMLLLVLGSDFIHGKFMAFEGLVEVLVYLSVFGVPIALVGMWLLGLPYACWLRRRGTLSIAALCLGAIPLGAVVFVAGLYLIGGRMSVPAVSGMGAATGVAVAVAFGLVSGIAWRR